MSKADRRELAEVKQRGMGEINRFNGRSTGMNMSVESGKVERIENGWAHVSTHRKGSCGGCSHKGQCHIVPGMDRAVVKAKNAVQAEVGDRVEFKLSSRTRLKGLFIMYMFPVFGLLIGAFSADGLSAWIGLNRDVGLFVFTLLGMAAGVFLARIVGQHMADTEQLTPVISRILKKAPPGKKQ